MMNNNLQAVVSLFAALSAVSSFSRTSVSAADFLEPIRPDSSVYYSTYPPCDASFQ